MTSVQASLDNWFIQHLDALKAIMRVVFGIVWAIDGAFKFQPGMAEALPGMVQDAGAGQPSWLAPWFLFWSQAVGANPSFFVISIGLVELALGLALIFGFLRKIAYTGGFFLSLLMWGVPEGFGGPYGPNSTDIGTGIIYAFVFLLLLIINATYGPSRWSLDRLIEKWKPGWAKVAEIRGDRRGPQPS